jgi:hypothetical protein
MVFSLATVTATPPLSEEAGGVGFNFGINLFGTISLTARTVGGNNFGGFTFFGWSRFRCVSVNGVVLIRGIVLSIARRMGVPINLPPVSPQPHTQLAFEGYQYAKQYGEGNEYNHRILEAFFVEGKDIGQIGVVTRLAGEVGLNEKELEEEALRTRKYREAHRRALRHAYEEAGVTGVPMFVIGDQVLTGLQDRKAVKA